MFTTEATENTEVFHFLPLSFPLLLLPSFLLRVFAPLREIFRLVEPNHVPFALSLFRAVAGPLGEDSPSLTLRAAMKRLSP